MLYSVSDAAGNTATQSVTVSIVNSAQHLEGNYTVTDTSSQIGVSVYSATCNASLTVNDEVRVSNFGNFGSSTSVLMKANNNGTIVIPTPVNINANTLQSASGSWSLQSTTTLMHFDYTYTDGSNTVTCSAGYVK